MPTYINPSFGDAITGLAQSFMGDPNQQARTLAAMAQARRAVAAAELDEQTGLGRRTAAGAFTDTSVPFGDAMRQALAGYSMGGADLSDVTPGISAAASLPGTRENMSPAQFGDILVGTGTQEYGDTPIGFGEGLQADIKQSRIRAGATIRSAQISAAAAAAAAAARLRQEREMAEAELIPAVSGGQTIYVPTAEAGGMLAPISETGAKGAIISEFAKQIADGTAGPNVLQMAGAALPQEDASPERFTNPDALVSTLTGRAMAPDSPGGPEVTPAEQAQIEQARALTSVEAKAKMGAPKNYITPSGQKGITLDGITDAATGEPLPAGSQQFTGVVQSQSAEPFMTTGTQTALESKVQEMENFTALADEAIRLADENPDAFGFTGRAQRFLQDATAQGRVFSGAFGGDLDKRMTEAAAKLSEAGVPVEYYRPGLPQVDQIATLLAYAAASAVADQTGRGLSDMDFRTFRDIVGNPSDLFASPESFKARVNQLSRIVEQRIGSAKKRLSTGKVQLETPPPGATLTYNPETGMVE